MDDFDDLAFSLDAPTPLVPHTAAGRLFSSVRRMKAEKEQALPVNRRTGFVVEATTGKPANALTEAEWDDLYETLCRRLKHEYPDLHQRLFP